MDVSDRNQSYAEAVAIISGATMMLPTRDHLVALFEAMQERHQVSLIQVADDLENLMRRTLERA